MGFTKSCCNAPKNKPSFEELPELSKSRWDGHLHCLKEIQISFLFREWIWLSSITIFVSSDTPDPMITSWSKTMVFILGTSPAISLTVDSGLGKSWFESLLDSSSLSVPVFTSPSTRNGGRFPITSKPMIWTTPYPRSQNRKSQRSSSTKKIFNLSLTRSDP